MLRRTWFEYTADMSFCRNIQRNTEIRTWEYSRQGAGLSLANPISSFSTHMTRGRTQECSLNTASNQSWALSDMAPKILNKNKNLKSTFGNVPLLTLVHKMSRMCYAQKCLCWKIVMLVVLSKTLLFLLEIRLGESCQDYLVTWFAQPAREGCSLRITFSD